MAFDTVENWVPKEWLSMNPRMNHQEALEKLYARTERIGHSVDMKQIKKMFAKSLKAYQRFG
ncbi:hypothetical protein D3C76_1752830 [compost metagenome]